MSALVFIKEIEKGFRSLSFRALLIRVTLKNGDK